jgi:hypothetical protein
LLSLVTGITHAWREHPGCWRGGLRPRPARHRRRDCDQGRPVEKNLGVENWVIQHAPIRREQITVLLNDSSKDARAMAFKQKDRPEPASLVVMYIN